MSTVLIFMANWRKWQRLLRSRKGFGLIDSARFGLWLARGTAAPTPMSTQKSAPAQKREFRACGREQVIGCPNL